MKILQNLKSSFYKPSSSPLALPSTARTAQLAEQGFTPAGSEDVQRSGKKVSRTSPHLFWMVCVLQYCFSMLHLETSTACPVHRQRRLMLALLHICIVKQFSLSSGFYEVLWGSFSRVCAVEVSQKNRPIVLCARSIS